MGYLILLHVNFYYNFIIMKYNETKIETELLIWQLLK